MRTIYKLGLTVCLLSITLLATKAHSAGVGWLVSGDVYWRTSVSREIPNPDYDPDDFFSNEPEYLYEYENSLQSILLDFSSSNFTDGVNQQTIDASYNDSFGLINLTWGWSDSQVGYRIRENCTSPACSLLGGPDRFYSATKVIDEPGVLVIQAHIYSEIYMDLVLHDPSFKVERVDIGAATYDYQIDEVPLPAAAWLFLSAIGGLGVLKRFKK